MDLGSTCSLYLDANLTIGGEYQESSTIPQNQIQSICPISRIEDKSISSVTVYVKNAQYERTNTFIELFIHETPTINSIFPDTGDAAANFEVVVRGRNFTQNDLIQNIYC